MHKVVFTLLLATICFGCPSLVNAQSDSLMTIPMFSGGFGFNLAGGDFADRFGSSIEVGGTFLVKTKSNWLYGVDAYYLYSDKVKEQVLEGVTSADGNLFGADGLTADVRTTMRGYKLPVVKLGRVFQAPFGRAGNNSGFFVMGGAGFIQHKIHFEDVTRNAPIVGEEYAKGFDRLTNGLLITEQFGYLFLDKRRRINFYVSVQFSQGFTKVRRSYDFAAKRRLDESRLDLMNGIKVGWIFPVYKKLPADFYYY